MGAFLFVGNKWSVGVINEIAKAHIVRRYLMCFSPYLVEGMHNWVPVIWYAQVDKPINPFFGSHRKMPSTHCFTKIFAQPVHRAGSDCRECVSRWPTLLVVAYRLIVFALNFFQSWGASFFPRVTSPSWNNEVFLFTLRKNFSQHFVLLTTSFWSTFMYV